MNELVPRGYFSPEEAIEYFGRRLKFAGWDTMKLSEIGREALKRELEKTEKISSKQEIQQLLRHLLFEEILSAKHFIGGEITFLGVEHLGQRRSRVDICLGVGDYMRWT